MKVVVKLHGVLRKHRPKDIPGSPHQPFELKLNDGTQIKELVSRLGIESGMVAGNAVNGEATSDDSPLHDADEISLFPPVAGG
jgi:molybdopterin converting factor small subunit